mgnify:FL=1
MTMSKYLVQMCYILDIPDKELEDVMEDTMEIANDAQSFIDEFAYESYCSWVERDGED